MMQGAACTAASVAQHIEGCVQGLKACQGAPLRREGASQKFWPASNLHVRQTNTATFTP
jgi:hypothetical protein